MTLLEKLELLGDRLKKLVENPIIDHSIDWLGDFVMGKMFIKEKHGDTTTRKINPEWLRKEAPRLYARTSLDENLLREITYSKYFQAAHRVSLFDNWGPNPTIADPDPLLGQIGPHQWDDFRLNLVDAMFETGPVLTPLKGAEKDEKIKELCNFLTEIAQLPNLYKLRRIVQLRYCRSRETDYKMVMFERLRGKVFASARDFMVEIRTWMNDPGPTGMLALSAIAATSITAATPIIQNAATNAANNLNNRAQQIRSRGLNRFFR
ncbi:MAG: hypothetical protein HY918_04985 [Candidatus Doudnabacteria bacterium]|nr:hypothetical protein [Candidatus Doudnabacteria bacterium]